MRLSLIGPGDVKHHFETILGLSQDVYEKHFDDITTALVESDTELVLLPDRGAPIDIARRAKKKGTKIYGTVPQSDEHFGISHLKKYMDERVNAKPLFDKFIDTGDWYKQDLQCCLFGDRILLLGYSLGSIGELAYAYYLYKLFLGQKPGVDVMKKKLHPDIRAGEHYSFDIIVYEPFVKQRLPDEIEAYIVKCGAKVHYVSHANELGALLR